MWQQLVGSQLDGKFRLVRLLGVGGFGAVSLAEEHVAGHLMRRIALKVIRSDRNRLSEQVPRVRCRHL